MVDRAVLFDLDDTLLVDEPDVDLHFRHVTADIDAAARVAAGSVVAAVRAAARERWRAGPLFAVARRLGFSSWEGLAADFVGGHPLVDPFREWVRPSGRRRGGVRLRNTMPPTGAPRSLIAIVRSAAPATACFPGRWAS